MEERLDGGDRGGARARGGVAGREGMGVDENLEVGDGSNIQDNVVLHVTTRWPCIIGKGVSIGHGAVVHGSVIGDNVLIGMNSTIVNDIEVGHGSLIAAGAVVPPGSRIPPHSLVVGVPGKVVKTDPDLEQQNIRNADHYHEVREAYLAGQFATSHLPSTRWGQRDSPPLLMTRLTRGEQ